MYVVLLYSMCCISPVLAAKVISGCEVTVGKSSGDCWPYAETCAGIEKLGVKCVEKEVDISFTYIIQAGLNPCILAS